MAARKPAAEGSPWSKEARLKNNVVVTSISLDPEARRLLGEMASPKSMGAFVSGLILAEQARREERQRRRSRARQAVLDN